VRHLIYLLIFLLLLISLLANPAPVAIEIADLFLISIPCFLAFLAITISNNYKVYQTENHLLIAVIFYLSFLLTSLLIGLIHGVPILTVLRSIGPYLDFFPLLLLCLLPPRVLNPWIIGGIFVFVGTLQASYQLFLYVQHSQDIASTAGILRSRITLIEPRTTLPLALASAILPLAYFASSNLLLRMCATLLILFALFASAATLTRSVILSIFVGWLVFMIIYLYQHRQQLSVINLLKQSIFYIVVFTISMSLLSLIPRVHMLEQGLLARFFHASASATTDYSNGRLYDEWIPALKVWMNSDLISLFFGIGAGQTFIVANGEERTYIHNLSIYSLVYGGFYGLFTCIGLYLVTFKTLIARASQTRQPIYLSFAALLAGLYFYGQLFAVHKGLAFNAMLFLMIAIALMQPTNKASRRA
jgi:hypothetical protein